MMDEKKPGVRPEDLRREHARVPASDETVPVPDGETPPTADERRLPKHPVPAEPPREA